jgi:hypothetical protein
MVLLLFGVYAACVHVRFILIFVMIVAPVMASFLARWMPSYDPDKEKYALNLAAIALLAFFLPKFLPGRAEVEKIVAKDYPVAAIEYGGYLIWKLGPQHKVFIDGRADMYEYTGVLQDYMHISLLQRDALSLLGKYGIRSCLIGRKSPLATLLSASPDWKQEYADNLSVLFVRSHPRAPAGN